ncbi:MAG: 16S rRNA (guanine(966)-N(2))-methyltransferase RsmD [Paracoccaceae bacterium]
MRIIAGQFRGLSLAGVGKGDIGAHLRPTSDRVRESLFNVLNGHGVLSEAHVLDLFAGTGAMGLEALSRGATDATFVDSGGKAAQLIRQNIALTRTKTQTRLIRSDVRKLPANTGPVCDVVFLDPPYGKGLGQIALNVAQEQGWIASQALIVWEESTPQIAPEGLTVLDKRRYGDTHVTIMQGNGPVLA